MKDNTLRDVEKILTTMIIALQDEPPRANKIQIRDIFTDQLEALLAEEVRKARIDELEALSMAIVEPCEPDCTPERHARHEGTWQAHLAIEARISKLKEK